jgi:hypothetical protein
MFQQHGQHLKGLFLQLDLHSVLPQFACAQVNLKDPEANDVRIWVRYFHDVEVDCQKSNRVHESHK